MSINIRFPNITAGTDREQLAQLKNYLYQLVEQLNYELTTISAEGAAGITADVQGETISYYELKSMIIQEQENIQALFAQLSQKMKSGYTPIDGWDADMLLGTDPFGKVITVGSEGIVNEVLDVLDEIPPAEGKEFGSIIAKAEGVSF